MKSVIIAFSTYSKIPMPWVEWDETSMKYSMAALPLVGAVIGFFYMLIFYASKCWLGLSDIFTATVLTVLPLIITGGIHLDGYMDTVDALCSYSDREGKLRILKDPHIGAFAVIYTAVYIMLHWGFTYQLILEPDSRDGLYLFAICFVLSRTLSGLAMVTFKSAKKEGMAAGIKAGINTKKIKTVNISIMMVWLALSVISLCIINPVTGPVIILACGLFFLIYRHVAYRNFGGITGDLAGWFLQLCELIGLIAIVLIQAGVK